MQVLFYISFKVNGKYQTKYDDKIFPDVTKMSELQTSLIVPFSNCWRKKENRLLENVK